MMSATPALVDRQTAAGRLVVRVVASMGQPWVQAQLDGTIISEAAGIGALPAPKQHEGRTITHYLTSRAGQSYAIYADEAALIEQEMEAWRARLAASPAGLREHRRGLLRDVTIARQWADEDRQRAWEQEDEAGAFVVDSHGMIAAAEQALAEFDQTHPEIAAQWDIADEAAREAELQNQVNYRGE